MPYLNNTFGKYLYRWLTSPSGDHVHSCQPQVVEQYEDEDVAIYCIHGTADQSSAFSFIAENIKPELTSGVKSIHQPSFKGRFQLHDITFFANQLKDKIIANKHKKVILIGHSRGALVASYFAEYLAKPNGIEVEAIINICGPFCGSDWAVFPFTYSESVNQMRKESPFLTILRNKMKDSDNAYYYFSGTKDILVSPNQAYIKEHAHHAIELDEDHFSIMSSKTLIYHLKSIIHHTLKKSPDAEYKHTF